MKKYLVILLIIFIPVPVEALSMPTINSRTALVYDLTSGEPLLSKNSNTRASIASLTKILTTITAIENISNLEEEITITKDMLRGIYWNASKAGLKAGDIVTYRDLLYASILPSGADATQVLALKISGSIPEFVNLMNKTAARVGMTSSHFVNVTGLDAKNHYSTAEDILKLLIYALNNPLFKSIYTTKEYTLTNNMRVESTLLSYTKKNPYDISRILGSKSGYTDAAGLCLSSLFNYHEHEILIITIGAPYQNSFPNLNDALTLIDYIDHNYEITTTETIELDIPKTPISNIKSRLKNNYKLYIFVGIASSAALFLIRLENPKKTKKRKK